MSFVKETNTFICFFGDNVHSWGGGGGEGGVLNHRPWALQKMPLPLGYQLNPTFI